jgi:hypothetical protein
MSPSSLVSYPSLISVSLKGLLVEAKHHFIIASISK